MSEFRSNPRLIIYDEHKELWQLCDDLIYHSSYISKVIVVPSGFITDFASVPRIVLAYLLFGNKGKKAAIVHDWLYSVQNCTRETADIILEEAMLATGYGWITRKAFLGAVRIGGWKRWNRDNVPQEPSVVERMEAA